MKLFTRYPLLFLFILSYINIAQAQKSDRFEISYDRGYQQENFNWSIAGNSDGQNPNVYSELKWQKLKGTLNSGNLSVRIWKQLGLSAGYSKTTITGGKVNDTDYGSDNRSNPVYNQNFEDNSGYTDSWYGALNYSIVAAYSFKVIPGVGYGRNRQSLNISDITGQFPYLNSTYANNWSGPFLNVKAVYFFIPDLSFKLNLSYNQVDYHAQANWNLISQFRHPVSFTDYAKGYGLTSDAEIAYTVIKHLKVHISGGYYYWETGKGNDNLYLATGETDVTQFNGAYRKGYRITGGVNFYF